MAGRAAFIGAMIGGGLLAAGKAQAQARPMAGEAAPPPATTPASTPDAGLPTLADRQAELVAASGGPAPVQHLIMAAPERPAVEARTDDVEDATSDPAAALNAAEAARGQGVAAPAQPPGPDR